MNTLTSIPAPQLDRCDRSTLLDYFENSWQLEDTLMRSLVSNDIFYVNPDPLRNPLVFYLGHSAVFYINKLVNVGLLDQRINPHYEILFEIGVDPTTPEELEEATRHINWPAAEDVWRYREDVRETIVNVINAVSLDLPIHPEHPLWALMMGIEHSRIHFETSSMLLRQLPVMDLERPDQWRYAPSHGSAPDNPLVEITGGKASLGKSVDATTYGWDSDYGHQTDRVAPFAASQHLVTNGEFLKFVQAGGYDNREWWDDESWQWKTEHQVCHPKFWTLNGSTYRYRAMFDELDLPLDWPVEANHHEAMAYCRWMGQKTRLMTEAEWAVASGNDTGEVEDNYNLHLKYSSPSPVGTLDNDQDKGIYDLRGNVWEWLGDNFLGLPGFEPHPLYQDYSEPFFDSQHKVMRGGSWASTGAYGAACCRNWFRPNFYQHAGFRLAQSL
ncbi:MAG: 5-histidylcysteine sulfoxide synthase [Cyanobacteria bacterium P01_F01_bin.42]